MKTAVIFLLFASAVLAAPEWRLVCDADSKHDLTDGCIKDPADALIHRETVALKGTVWQTKTRTITYPETGTIKGPLTCIKVKDLMPNNKGGCAYVKSGGNGFNDVSIVLMTQGGKGMQFQVEIYGTKA